MMKSSYSSDDVILLLKDISGLVEPLATHEREKEIQKGVHYCEMLPLEYQPTAHYLKTYDNALENYAKVTADAVAKLSEKIFKDKGEKAVVVSLARAGIPIGILIKRYIKKKYGGEINHYAISIIRDKGIDHNAMEYILKRHSPEDIQFIDGWIGKGTIINELRKELDQYPEVSTSLGVVSDPAHITDLCGTHEDILIPSACLNATVTGLVSRTFLRSDIIGHDDFHGAMYLGDLENSDVSNAFLETIEGYFNHRSPLADERHSNENGEMPLKGIEIVKEIARAYQVKDINFIKPGIGEATRVLLRRVPWKVLIHESYSDADELLHIRQLAKEKNVPVEVSKVPLGNYKVCGIIQSISDV